MRSPRGGPGWSAQPGLPAATDGFASELWQLLPARFRWKHLRSAEVGGRRCGRALCAHAHAYGALRLLPPSAELPTLQQLQSVWVTGQQIQISWLFFMSA